MKSKKSEILSNIEVIFPADINHHGTLFGGQLMSWMDKTAYYSAFQYAKMAAVTASVEALDFAISPVVGDFLDFQGQVIYTGRSSMVVRVQVYRTAVNENNLRRLANTGYFTFVAVDENSKPQPIPPLLVETEEEKRSWAKGKELKDAATARR